MSKDTPEQIKLDERHHVEKPLLDQLHALGWEILDLDAKQHPRDTFRESFAEVAMLPVLRERLKTIQPWLEDDQIEDAMRQIATGFVSSDLLKSNRQVHDLLLGGVRADRNRQTGETSPTVRFVDFETPANNRFMAVCQFKVRVLGTEKHIIPDIVLFVNGLPLVVIEAKSPKVKEPLPEAIEQLLRYSEQRGAKGEGSPLLFFYNLFLVVTCRQEAKFGTITTRTEKHFYRWSDPFPRTLDDLTHGASSPNDQQRLVAGMMEPRNLLDILRTFTLFATNDKGEMIKVVGRYQQFRAVKLAVKRLLEGGNKRERSGIIWHTQGSGKSLTMMFMVREMYRHATLAKWKVVFVTDRTQLEAQLGETSQSVGYTVKVADSIKKLKELLASTASDLVMAMIHKFQESDLETTFPELNASPHILVMTDEAHRSQYSLLGANLDKAIPNATKIGYTGTPIDKTERVFGDYIDKYTMRQSIEDGVTLEIVYEGRTHTADTPDPAGMDQAFVDVFQDYTPQQCMEILGYGSRDAYLEAEPTIAAKARDMVGHYLRHVFPNGYKAQIVATSREAAVRYKAQVDEAIREEIARLESDNPFQLDLETLRSLQSDVIISGKHNDEMHLLPYTNPSRHETTIKSFKLPFGKTDQGVRGDVGIVIVNNMLLTGFDAPVEQVLYLDKIIVAHGLLQAITRVNRVAGDAKEKGFVVDYVGIGHHLKTALGSYDEREQKEVLDVLSFPEQELRDLQASHTAIFALLKAHGLTNLKDYDAFFDTFYDEDIRFEFLELFKTFASRLDLVFPAKEALDYLPDLKALSEINVMAGKHFRDSRMSMKGVTTKLRKIADAHLESVGIDVTVEPISILHKDFQDDVQKHVRAKTKAAQIEHAIRHHLDVDLDDDPELRASFAEALRMIFEQFAENWSKIHDELELLRQRILNVSKEPTYGLHPKKQMPFFRLLRREVLGDATENVSGQPFEAVEPPVEEAFDEEVIGGLVRLTQHVTTEIERELKLTGFWTSIPARNKLVEELQRTLLLPEFSTLPGLVRNRKAIISRIMEVAERNQDAILYAT